MERVLEIGCTLFDGTIDHFSAEFQHSNPTMTELPVRSNGIPRYSATLAQQLSSHNGKYIRGMETLRINA